jgi:prepilin-type N-terminal cleavage/methylation domain-containing protein
MMQKKRTSGVSLVELLVALAIGGILLGVLGAFFSQQTRHSVRLQAQQDVSNKVRAVAEIITQDLQVAGSQPIVRDGAEYIDLLDTSCNTIERYGCIVRTGGSIRILYATSLEPDHPCRIVEYILDEDAEVLYRRDDPCGTVPDPDLSEHVLADGITGLSLQFRCAVTALAPTPLVVDDPLECYTEDTVVVEALIAISGSVSIRQETMSSTFETGALTPNLRRIDLY